MNPFYPAVAKRAEHRCEYCRAPESAFNFPFEVDHIEPRSHGGEAFLRNLALSCRSCNAFKSARFYSVSPAFDNANRLFHPRLDDWRVHFAINEDTLEIESATRIGELTIAVLQWNSAPQLTARRQWARIGLFP